MISSRRTSKCMVVCLAKENEIAYTHAHTNGCYMSELARWISVAMPTNHGIKRNHPYSFRLFFLFRSLVFSDSVLSHTYKINRCAELRIKDGNKLKPNMIVCLCACVCVRALAPIRLPACLHVCDTLVCVNINFSGNSLI